MNLSTECALKRASPEMEEKYRKILSMVCTVVDN